MGKSKLMRMITLFMAEKDIERLDALVEQAESPNRSELLRFIVKSYLIDHERGFVKLPPAEEIIAIGAPEIDDVSIVEARAAAEEAANDAIADAIDDDEEDDWHD